MSDVFISCDEKQGRKMSPTIAGSLTPQRTQDQLNKDTKVIKIVKPRLIFVSSDGPINSQWSDYTVLNYALDAGEKDLANILLKGHCRVNGDLKTPSDTPLHKAVRLGDMELLEKLLAKGASWTAVDPEGNTVLHLAFILKSTEMVRFLLVYISKQEVYKNLKNNQGLTYLHIACTQKDQSIAQALLNSGANILDSVNEDSPYWPGFTALHFAIKFKCEETAHALIQADTKNAKEKLNDSLIIDYIFHQQNNKDKYGLCKELTNFHVACMRDNPDILQRYMEFGAAINLPLSKEVTLCPLYLPLHFAVDGNCKRNVQVLLEHGAMADLCDSLKMTPLHLAFYHERDEIVDLLWAALKDNLIVNKRDYYHLSYLHVAVARNELDVVKKFCDDGEDINARVLRNEKNFSGYTPLMFAVEYQHLDMARFLVNRGADVNVGTPLHLAVADGDKTFVDFLMSNGVKVDMRDEDGQTVLHILVKSSDLKMPDYAEKFVKLGCDVNAEDSNNNTALHLACSETSYKPSYVKTLLDLGADVDAKNAAGRTPLMEARKCRSPGFCDVLYCHIRKLRAIGVKICSSNEVAFKQDCKFNEVDQQIKDEVGRMKEIKLLGCMPLVDFLLLDANLASIYVEDEKLKLMVEDKKLMQIYPMYGYLIKLQFRRGKEYLDRQKRSLSVEILEEVAPKRKRCEWNVSVHRL